MMHKLIFKRSLMLAVLLISSAAAVLYAQDKNEAINGKVTDVFGKPLNGVVVKALKANKETLTNAQGEYTLNSDKSNELLTFYYKGFSKRRMEAGNQTQIDIQLKSDPHHLDEMVQLGYTSQLRREISGAVATVSGEELEKSPVANLTQTLAGRLTGLFTQETYSELSKANTSLYVRGLSAGRLNNPLVIIDGIITSYNSSQSMEYITANEIESISVLKDASTQALYGIQGANGVIVITTKRGRSGGLQITGRIDQSVQQVTSKPTFYSAAEYAEMRNQAAFNDGLGANYFFSAQEIENYRSGQKPDLYPSNNWYEKYMKDFATMERVGVNVSGGNDKVQFFSNINFMHQGGQFNTDQSKYNPNSNNTWINYRTNVDMSLNKYLKAFIRLGGNIKRERTPGAGNSAVYSSLFSIPPTSYGPLTPAVRDATGKVITEGGKVITTERVAAPSYGMLNRTGYWRHTVTNITSQFGLDLDMSFLTKGLKMTGVLAYQTNSVGSLGTTQDYERWVRTDRRDTLAFTKKGSTNNTPLAYSKNHSYYYHLTYNTAMNYYREFGKHHIGGMAYMFYQNLTTAETQSPGLLPYNRVSSGAEATYGFDNRYLLKIDMGYSGSEQYPRNSRFITTPAVSAAWVLSNEAFMREVKALSNFKLRASYGKTANDQNGLARFSYLDNVIALRGGPIGYLQYFINENQVGNPEIQAEISTKQNFGLDLGLFNSLSISLDVFKERVNNLVVGAGTTVPLYQGVPLGNYPKTNSGAFENKGYEINANYTVAINRNVSVFAGGMISYAKNTVIKVNEALKTVDYAYRNLQEGYSFGQTFGYLIDYSNGNGYFNSLAEINDSKLTYGFGKVRVGDLRYRDLNNDKKIDERDKAPLGTGALPRVTYALSAGATYKSFDLSLLFQGVGQYSSTFGGPGIWETANDGVFGALHANAWTQARYDNKETITSPALSIANNINHEASDFNTYNRSYLRLKNLELSYTVPASLSRKIAAGKVRFLFSGQNLITWDKMKSDDFGPEGGGYLSFPVYRVYNIGINVVF